jgi:hypothetical protein
MSAVLPLVAMISACAALTLCIQGLPGVALMASNTRRCRCGGRLLRSLWQVCIWLSDHCSDRTPVSRRKAELAHENAQRHRQLLNTQTN